jgi:predicted permease
MSQVLQDIRIAFRVMRRRPLVTVSVVAILGAGIGANTAIFRVFSATFLRPLPFADEDALVRVYVSPAEGGARISPRTDVFLGLRDAARSFAGIVGQRFMDMTLTGPAGPERVTGIAVTEGWAATLGVRPMLGRTFQPDETRLGLAAPVTVISHAVWRERFGGDPGVVGREVRLDGRARVVIGVMPPGLRYPYEADFWVPMVPGDDADAVWGYNIQARLRDGATLAEARAELATLSTQLPAVRRLDMALVAFPLRELLVGDDGRMIGVLLGAVGFLLLIVSANVAHLMLAESLSRRQEFALRMALGATRGRTLRQLLTEGCVVGLLGGAVGLAIALAAESLLRVLLPSTLTQVFASTPLDGRVFLFTLTAALATGMLAGMIPAAWVSRRAPHTVLRNGGHGAVRGGLGRVAPVLIVSELALALILLSGAGVLLEDLARRQDLDLGYRAADLLTLNVALTSDRYAQGDRRTAFLDGALSGIRALPGVDAAAAVTTFPAEGQGTFLSRLEFEGRPPRPEAPVIVHARLVSDDFFGTMGMPVVRGRGLDATDGPEAPPVAVVSRSLADRHWPGQDPLGQRVRERRADGSAPWRTVVGVVDDVREFYAETGMAWYVPFAQEPESRDARQAVFVVRAPTTTGSVIRQVREAIWGMDPELAVFDVADAATLYQRSLAARRSAGLLVALFAGVGLLVASFGVYASVAFAVGARSRETAVRMAVGADAGRIVRAFVRQGAVLVAVGLALGGLGAVALSGWVAGVTDGGRLTPVLGLAAAVVLSAVALLASYLPARRAARADPARVLRAG